MNGICASGCPELSHHSIVFHIDQITGRWVRVPSTTTVTVAVPTGIRDQCSKSLRNTIARSSNSDVLITPF
jgi:hypothetical protein